MICAWRKEIVFGIPWKVNKNYILINEYLLVQMKWDIPGRYIQYRRVENLMHLMGKASRVDSIGQASKFSAKALICCISRAKSKGAQFLTWIHIRQKSICFQIAFVLVWNVINPRLTKPFFCNTDYQGGGYHPLWTWKLTPPPISNWYLWVGLFFPYIPK